MTISENAKRFMKFNQLGKRTVNLMTRVAHKGSSDLGSTVDKVLEGWELALDEAEKELQG